MSQLATYLWRLVLRRKVETLSIQPDFFRYTRQKVTSHQFKIGLILTLIILPLLFWFSSTNPRDDQNIRKETPSVQGTVELVLPAPQPGDPKPGEGWCICRVGGNGFYTTADTCGTVCGGFEKILAFR